jgi:hypothetical protein
MRRLTLVCAAALMIGCAKKDAEPAADSSAMMAPPAAQTINLADVAGRWRLEVSPVDRDTVLLTYEMTATADTAGWLLHFPGKDPVPMRIVSVAGDSIVAVAGPYPSALRAGQQVTTNVVTRLVGGQLVSSTTAHYATTGPDSVVNFRSRGTRIQ